MADRWIVSNYRYCEHFTLEKARQEARRLHERHGSEFRVYRVKTSLQTRHPVVLSKRAARIVADSLRATAEGLRALAHLPTDPDIRADLINDLGYVEAIERNARKWGYAQEMEAGTGETALAGSTPEARQPDPEGDAP